MNRAHALWPSRLGSLWASLFMALALLVVLSPSLAQAAITFPALTGRVVDEAQLLSPAQEAELTTKLAALETQTGDQLVVVTLSSLQDQDIADYGYQLGRHWGIGQKENDGGALLIVAPNERRVRIEVGYGLEGVLTDGWSGLLIQNQILPAFRQGDYAGGIITGTNALIEQLMLDPADAAARAAEAQKQAEQPSLPVLPLMVFGFIGFIFLITILGSLGGRRRRGNRWHDDDDGPGGGAGDALGGILIWAASEALRSRGGGGGGGFGGGGFGGGGGGFGGGGASGGW